MNYFSGQFTFDVLVNRINSSDFDVINSLSSALQFNIESSHEKFALVPFRNSSGAKNSDDSLSKTLYFSMLSQTIEKVAVFSISQEIGDKYSIVCIEKLFPISIDHVKAALYHLASFVQREFKNTAVVIGIDNEDSDGVTNAIKDSLNTSIPELILTAGPSISILESMYVMDATRNGWNANHSSYINRFEEEFAEYVGAEFAMATSSCSGALHLSLLSLGIGPGDEVIVPDITWVATASAVRYVGAKPVFADIDPKSWTIDCESLRSKITHKTRAIIPVHLYGFGADMLQVVEIAREFGIYVIEDAAPAIGTQIGLKKAGTFGDFGCYSFQGAKLLVTGEGGMLVTDNDELMAKARKIQDHGRRPGTFWIEELGFKYKMNNITAALGLGQIQRADQQISKKREIAQWYRNGLESLPNIYFQQEVGDTKSIHWMTSFYLDSDTNKTRDGLIAKLKQDGVDSRPVFPSISQYEIWGYKPEVPAVSKMIGDNGINLPSGVNLNRESVEKVIRSVREFLD
jgi:perosamine synthetase